MSEFKYIVIPVELGEVTLEIPIVFPKVINHDAMDRGARRALVETYRESFEHRKTDVHVRPSIRAGFVSIATKSTHGRSETLKLESSPDDMLLITTFPYTQGIREAIKSAAPMPNDEPKEGYMTRIEWGGGESCPVHPDTIVKVYPANGEPRDPVESKYWPDICWQWREPEDPKSGWNITAYEVYPF